MGGGPYQGAPYLAGMAALRSGADIVRIASPDSYTEPDLIYTRLDGQFLTKDHIETLLPYVERADVLICGNGLGPDSHEAVLGIVSCAKKAVIDADALRLPLPLPEEVVYTPHSHEFERIYGVRPPSHPVERANIVRKKAGKGTVLLKGEIDIISDGTRIRFNSTGCSEMTTGGTGDVLAGITGGLLCRISAFEAACAAAYLNGKTGEIAAKEKGDGLIGSDLIKFIPGLLYGDEKR